MYVDDFENVQLNIVDLQEIKEEMLGWNLVYFKNIFLWINSCMGHIVCFIKYVITCTIYIEELLYQHIIIYHMYAVYVYNVQK